MNKIRECLLQVAGVIVVALWEAHLRIRGKWRCSALREWLKRTAS